MFFVLRFPKCACERVTFLVFHLFFFHFFLCCFVLGLLPIFVHSFTFGPCFLHFLLHFVCIYLLFIRLLLSCPFYISIYLLLLVTLLFLFRSSFQCFDCDAVFLFAQTHTGTHPVRFTHN